MRVVMIVLAMCSSGVVNAAKTYTHAQLAQMIEAGRYPAQAAPTSKRSAADFAACKAKMEAVLDAVRGNYPVQDIANTSLVVTRKLWTNDAALTITCSGPDKAMIITTAPYK